ncbi:MAG: YqgE/AlgH family protein [Thermoanaerobaculia bacterium]|jgi:putative transcriptional regulator
MADTGSPLETPALLLAMPQVLDPFFYRSVILLLRHNDEGSHGFIINRPTEIELSEILKGMEITWHGEPTAMAFFGGPVQSQIGSVMFTSDSGEWTSDTDKEGPTEVSPGIHISQSLEDLGRLAADPPESFRLFLGYAGWGPDQLMDEIMRNDWLTAPVLDELLFSAEPEGMWATALRSVGIDPAALPSWVPGTEVDRSN